MIADGRGNGRFGISSTRSSTCCAVASPGVSCPTTCHRRARCSAGSRRGVTTACSRTINHHLVMTDRERVGREASPTAVVLDSQSVKTIESGGPSGYDAGKKVKGRKRQVMVDTDGRGMILDPQPGQRTGSRWRTAGAAPVTPLFPVRDEGLRRQRLRRPEARDGDDHRRSRSSRSRRIRSASPSIRAVGSSSGSLPGSAETDASGKIRRPPPSHRQRPSSTRPPS